MVTEDPSINISKNDKKKGISIGLKGGIKEFVFLKEPGVMDVNYCLCLICFWFDWH